MTMISDPLWTTPLDTNRKNSSDIHLSFNVYFSRPSALLSCQVVPLSVSHLPFTLHPLPSAPVACWQWTDLEEGCCDKYGWPCLFCSQTVLTPHWLLTFFNWSKQVKRNQLPSGSISAASQILGLVVSLADSERRLARQPSGASVLPNRCQEWEILWQDALHTSFIHDIVLVLSFWQTF